MDHAQLCCDGGHLNDLISSLLEMRVQAEFIEDFFDASEMIPDAPKKKRAPKKKSKKKEKANEQENNLWAKNGD